MQVVGAALGADVHGRAGGVAEGGIVRGDLDAKLRDGAGRGDKRHADAAIAQVGRGIGDAVDLKLGVEAGSTGYRDLRRPAR